MDAQRQKEKDEEDKIRRNFSKAYRQVRSDEGLDPDESAVFRSDVDSPQLVDVLKRAMTADPAGYVRVMNQCAAQETTYADACGMLVQDYIARNGPKIKESITRELGNKPGDDFGKAWNAAKIKHMKNDPMYAWAAEDPQVLVGHARDYGAGLDNAGYVEDPVKTLKAMGVEVPPELEEVPDSDPEY